MDHLGQLEAAAKKWASDSDMNEQVQERVGKLLNATVAQCAWLRLRSAWKQLHRILETVKTGKCTSAKFSSLIGELRIRIYEDLEDRVFFSVVDTGKIDKFFKEDPKQRGCLMPKPAEEIFSAEIVKEFPEAAEDLIEASACFVVSRYTASVFHLMRVVERGVTKLAQLAGHADPKSSWNNTLRYLDKVAYKTEYKDVPDAVKPYLGLVKDTIPKMQAMEHAWRNRVMHIENKLYPADPFDRPIATDVMIAVDGFMRTLAKGLAKDKSERQS